MVFWMSGSDPTKLDKKLKWDVILYTIYEADENSGESWDSLDRIIHPNSFGSHTMIPNSLHSPPTILHLAAALRPKSPHMVAASERDIIALGMVGRMAIKLARECIFGADVMATGKCQRRDYFFLLWRVRLYLCFVVHVFVFHDNKFCHIQFPFLTWVMLTSRGTTGNPARWLHREHVGERKNLMPRTPERTEFAKRPRLKSNNVYKHSTVILCTLFRILYCTCVFAVAIRVATRTTLSSLSLFFILSTLFGHTFHCHTAEHIPLLHDTNLHCSCQHTPWLTASYT